MSWLDTLQQEWIPTEISDIQNKAKVSPTEAKTILEQRLTEIATTNKVTKEEASTIYKQLQTNKKTKQASTTKY